MVKVIGKDPKVAKHVVCPNCSSILEYLPKDIKTNAYVHMNEMDTRSYIDCPDCKHQVTVKR